jgi:hypothetical protein
MPIRLLSRFREQVREIDCPHRRKRRQKIRNKVKRIRMYRKVRESIEYHPVLISLMVLMYKMQ